jgi:hypothetical protein
LKKFLALGLLIVYGLTAGCADVEFPNTSEFIKDPLSSPVKIGMTQDQVVDIYGEPSIKSTVVSDKWGKPREEWIYRASSGLPVGTAYLSRDLYLYFDGENLTNISRESLGKEAD